MSLAVTILAYLQTVQHSPGSKKQAERNPLHSVGNHPALDLHGDFIYLFMFFLQDSWPCELILAPNKRLCFEPYLKGTLMSKKKMSLLVCFTDYFW